VNGSRRNVLLLALCQATFITTSALMSTIGTLAGYALAGDKAFATLPATAITVGTALGTIPASIVMRRVGRRLGFIIGTGFTMAGGFVGAWAIVAPSFGLLIAGGFLMGVASAFAQLYRFAAAEAVSPERRARAISLVLAGGLLAGFVGPQLARYTSDLLATRFVASFLCMPLLAVLSMTLMLGLRLPEVEASQVHGATRTVGAIMRQPLFLVAVASQMVGYGVMNLLMTGAPLAIVTHHGHGIGDAAFVIEWHLVGMFLPSFFTGALIQRIGQRTTIAIGIAANAASLAAGLVGTTVRHFWLSLLLVGIGWNLMFVGGSTLVTLTYTPSERTKAQAANDFLIWATVAITSLSSGQLLHRHGWNAILVTAAPLLGLAAAALVALWLSARLGSASPRAA
jgi:predicted MFS family arabinose efflux permease